VGRVSFLWFLVAGTSPIDVSRATSEANIWSSTSTSCPAAAKPLATVHTPSGSGLDVDPEALAEGRRLRIERRLAGDERQQSAESGSTWTSFSAIATR
jgi:hypothetical protein